MHDRFQVEQGGLKQFVDYNVVKFSGLCHLVGGVLQAQVNDVGGVFATVVQARFQFFPARRQDEDEYRIGKQLFDLNRALKSISKITSAPCAMRSSMALREVP